MAWKKSAQELVERFHTALPQQPEAQPRKMFGYPCCFVNGNFFVGMHEDNFVVRLPGLKDKFTELASAKPFDPMGTGKGMKDWWVIPPEIAGDEKKLSTFFSATFPEVRKLPAKPAKNQARKKPAKAE